MKHTILLASGRARVRVAAEGESTADAVRNALEGLKAAIRQIETDYVGIISVPERDGVLSAVNGGIPAELHGVIEEDGEGEVGLIALFEAYQARKMAADERPLGMQALKRNLKNIFGKALQRRQGGTFLVGYRLVAKPALVDGAA